MNWIYLFSAFVWGMAVPFNAFAHGTDYRLLNKKAVVAAEFFYSDKTPMRYAEILVFSPENEKVEYQNGRTDQNGRFAFLPKTTGKWQIKVNDGVGHMVNAIVTVNSIILETKNDGDLLDGQGPKVSKERNSFLGNASMAVRLVFGLSILLNIFLCVSVWKNKS